MTTFFKATLKLLSFSALCVFAACNMRDPIDISLDDDIPYQSVFVTAQGERVEGVPDTAGAHINSIYLKFAEASDFSDVNIELSATSGYTCVYPENMSSVDLTKESVLIFRSPNGQKVKYFFNVDSAGKMIVDGSKVTVDGAPGVVLRVDDLSSTITIPYDPALMKQSSIKLIFGEGALDEGVYAGTSKFDFTSSLVRKMTFSKMSDEYRGKRDFSVILSVSSLLTDYSKYGFRDITASCGIEAEDAEHIVVYQADALKNIPIRNKDPKTGEYYPETPYIEGVELDDSLVFDMPGSWKSSRPTIDFPNADTPTQMTPDISINIVLLDPEYFTARVDVDDSHRSKAGQLDGFVTMSGYSPEVQTYMWSDGKIYSAEATEGSSMEKANVFRYAVGVTDAGEFQITLAAWNKEEQCWYKWTDGYMTPANLAKATQVSAMNVLNESKKWTGVKSVACSVPCGCMSGHLLTNIQMIAADVTHGHPSYGDGWNGLRRRGFMGITYDNKIGLATFSSKAMQTCIGSYQAIWLLNRLGWRDVIQTGTEFYKDDNFNPVLKVNGNMLNGTADMPSFYSIVFDKKGSN